MGKQLRRDTIQWWLWEHADHLDWLAVVLFNLIIAALVLLAFACYA